MGIGDLPPWVVPDSEGFVFATTGEEYTTLARRAARTLRAVTPRCNVDLFTDQIVEDDVFDQIHRLDHSWFRPKMQAIRESRFERTVVMDADMLVVADISEVFQVLDHCDIAGVEGVTRQKRFIPPDPTIPRCVPPINSGFLAVLASPQLHAFAQAWEDDVRSSGSKIDQPAFRRMICHSDLKFLPLGTEYNAIWLDRLDIWPEGHGAPRVLHVRELHKRPPGDPRAPFSLEEALGKERAAHVENLLATDWSLGADSSTALRLPIVVLRESHRPIGSEPGRKRPRTNTPESNVRGFSSGLRSLLGLVNKQPGNQGQNNPSHSEPKRGKQGGENKTARPYWAAVLALANFRSPLRICIVGANDGRSGDPIFPLIKRHLTNETDVLLFEPQPYLIPHLIENYAFHPSHHIVNAAIGPDIDLVLHAVRQEAWDRLSPGYAEKWPNYRAPTGVTSTERQLVVDWVKKHGPAENNPEEIVVELRVPCARLPDALEALRRSLEIDVLQVDAEGFDDEVIYACDLDRTRPAIVYFEENHLPAERRRRLREHLEKDYRLMAVRRDVLAIRRV